MIGNWLTRARQADPATEEKVMPRLRADVELPGVLQKEITFFGEEQAEACEVHLLLIRLHLGKIRVDRDIEVQARRHSVLHVQPDVSDRRRRHGGFLTRGAGTGQNERFDSEVHALAQRAHAGERAREAHPRQLVSFGNRRPIDPLVLPGNIPHEVDAPGLRLHLPKTDRGHGNGDLGRPPVARSPGGHHPDAVPVSVDVGVDTAPPALALLEDLLLELGSQGIRHEHVAGTRVVEGIDDDLEVVFLQDAVRVASHLGGDERARVVGTHTDEERAGFVDQPNFRSFSSGSAFGGLLLGERVDDGRGLPHLFVQDAIEVRDFVDAAGFGLIDLAIGGGRGG